MRVLVNLLVRVDGQNCRSECCWSSELLMIEFASQSVDSPKTGLLVGVFGQRVDVTVLQVRVKSLVQRQSWWSDFRVSVECWSETSLWVFCELVTQSECLETELLVHSVFRGNSSKTEYATPKSVLSGCSFLIPRNFYTLIFFTIPCLNLYLSGLHSASTIRQGRI